MAHVQLQMLVQPRSSSKYTRSIALRVLLLACLTLFVGCQVGTSDAPVEAAAVSHSLVVPETQPIEASGHGASPMSTWPEATKTSIAIRRNSRRQAEAALRAARPVRPLLEGSSSGNDTLGSQAICGYNSLVADSKISNCRIVTSYGGSASSCSAVKIGDKLLATAGHCIYSKPSGGWATGIDVYCTGSVTCSKQRTTYATNLITTPSWIASPTNVPTAWDGAVIKTAGSLPGPTLQLAQIARTGAYQVTLTGYPAQSGDPGCSTSAFSGACYQYTSTDKMEVTSSGMYQSSNLDLCSGHSGSGVMTADSSRYVVAIVSGASFSPCANYFVPQINSNSGVNADCEKASGGVSFACLAAKLPK